VFSEVGRIKRAEVAWCRDPSPGKVG
jgi:hypothetical protein